MTDEKSRRIFRIRSEIVANKAKGFKVVPTRAGGKTVAYIVCKELNINFYIDHNSLEDLRLLYLRSGVTGMGLISFYDWLLKNELVE